MHIIENEFLKVTAREFGAELTSVISKKTGIEHIWQADPSVWGWHAPVLFPVVGRCLNDAIIVEGKIYPMQKHGFARKTTFELMEISEDRVVFSLIWNEHSMAFYPFKFEFLIAYTIHENTLTCSYEVRNIDDKEILFSLGGHPAFRVPFFDNEQYNDYSLLFEHSENSQRHLINTDGFFDGRREDVFNSSNRIKLSDSLFNEDALIFKDLKSRKVSLGNELHEHKIDFDFSDFNYLGIWAKPCAQYVCLEPWLGCADTANICTEFKYKDGVLALNPHEEKQVSWSITSF
jgi:galactose mutarotase-like enzyme